MFLIIIDNFNFILLLLYSSIILFYFIFNIIVVFKINFRDLNNNLFVIFKFVLLGLEL